MPFRSILFENVEQRTGLDERGAPAFFRDLNLDHVVASITAGRDEYHLQPFFYTPLQDVQAIDYRQQVFRDLETAPIRECIRTFARQMRAMREHLTQADKLYYRYQKESWFLDAVAIYVTAVADLRQGLRQASVVSRGLRAFLEYLLRYVESREFVSLASETTHLTADLAAVAYTLLIHRNRIKVSRYEAETDYAAEIEQTFEKFKRGAVEEYRVDFRTDRQMNHVEGAVLDEVAELYPDTFLALDRFHERHRGYLDQVIADFDREIQFYLAYLEFVQRFSPAELRFCYPQVSARSKEVSASDTFDVALANRLVPAHSAVVRNDFNLRDPERIFVVTGPNQGGKTTFARTFGQLHYLAGIGCLVPGTGAQLFLFDHLFAHFEREEDLTNLRGKLQDDLVRIHDILEHATPRSIIVMNEIFTATTLVDAIFLSKKVLERIMDMDALCVLVTFVDELASLSATTVSLVSTVLPDDPTVRTFKILRRPADGRAYAAAIAEKYGLSYERLRARVTR